MRTASATEARPEADGKPTKFATRDVDLTRIWNAMQCEQVDFAVNQELAVYHVTPSWDRARHVLDLGTGNGYYLRQIATRFPDKHYRGIDRSQELVELAKRGPIGGQIEFECRDVVEETGCYDFVIMRLLLQHLPDCDAVLGRVADMTVPGGAAFVIEALDPLRFFTPAVPEFMDLFRAYVEEEASRGLRRDVAERLPRLVEPRGQWRIGETHQFIVPSTLPGNLERFRRIYGLFIDMVERAGVVEADFDRVRREWEAWGRIDTAYAQVGVNVIRLDRV